MSNEFSPGLTVRVRNARFQVLESESVQSNSSNEKQIRRLRLRCLEDPWRNEEIIVLHPLEKVEPDKIPELDLSRPGRLARFHLLMDAIRLTLSPAENRL